MPYHASSSRTHEMTLTAVLLALATVLGYVEAVLFPSMPFPGFKIGLANIAVVIAIATVGPIRAAVVSLGRVFLVALATGTLGGPVMLLALSGALAAWGVMALMARQQDAFSVVGWALAGSAAHAIAQILAAVIITGTAAPIMLMPMSLAASIVAGLIVGVVSYVLISRIPLMQTVHTEG